MPRRKETGQHLPNRYGTNDWCEYTCGRGHVRCAIAQGGTCHQPDKKAPRGKPFGKDGDERRKQEIAAKYPGAIPCKRPDDNTPERYAQGQRWMDSPTAQPFPDWQGHEHSLWLATQTESEREPMTANDGHKTGDSCPSCKTGRLQIRTGKFGSFLGCDAYPVCRFSRSLSKDEQDTVHAGEQQGAQTGHGEAKQDPAAYKTESQASRDGDGQGNGDGEGGKKGKSKTKGNGEQGEGDEEGEGEGEGNGPEDPITKRIREIAREEDATVVEAVAEALQKLQAQIAEGGTGGKSEITIKLPDAEHRAEIEGNPHPLLDRVLFKAMRGQNIMLVGPAGCGKTYLAHQLAKVLPTNAALPGEDGKGRYFATVSCTAGMTESQLTGRYIPTGERGIYLRAEFVRCYEDGGVFLLDEFDAADSNVVLVLNQALANGRLPLPNRVDNPVAIKHPDFVLIVACNTYGKGADRQYVGRNQMDAATLDRFVGGVVSMDYDRALEEKLTVAKLGKEKATPVLTAWWGVRDKVAALKLRQVVSTRGLLAVVDMLATGEHEKPALAIRDALEAWPSEDRVKVGVAA